MKRKQSGLVPRKRKVGAKDDPVVSCKPMYGDARPISKSVKQTDRLAEVEGQKKEREMAKGGEVIVEKAEQMSGPSVGELKRRAARAGHIYNTVSAGRLRIEELETAHSQLYKILDDCCAELAKVQGARQTLAGEAARSRIAGRAGRAKAKIIRTVRAMAKQRARLAKLQASAGSLEAFDLAAQKVMAANGIAGEFPRDFQPEV